jgi:hypothetical protein
MEIITESMSPREKIAFKNRLKNFAISVLEQRIQGTRLSIENAQQNANQEEKSSAGDKYETSRAMSHLERDMHARRQLENLKELAGIHSIDTNNIYDMVSPGAFLETSAGAFFIATGLGKQFFEGERIIFLSPASALAKLLVSKKKGDSFLLNGVESKINLVI